MVLHVVLERRYQRLKPVGVEELDDRASVVWVDLAWIVDRDLISARDYAQDLTVDPSGAARVPDLSNGRVYIKPFRVASLILVVG